MTTRRLWIWVALLIFPLAAGKELWGQAAGSSIRGRVVDASGLPIVGATIVATDLATGKEYQASSREDGNYSVPALTLGAYRLQASAAGFRTFVNPSVQVNVATTTRVD